VKIRYNKNDEKEHGRAEETSKRGLTKIKPLDKVIILEKLKIAKLLFIDN